MATPQSSEDKPNGEECPSACSMNHPIGTGRPIHAGVYPTASGVQPAASDFVRLEDIRPEDFQVPFAPLEDLIASTSIPPASLQDTPTEQGEGSFVETEEDNDPFRFEEISDMPYHDRRMLLQPDMRKGYDLGYASALRMMAQKQGNPQNMYTYPSPLSLPQQQFGMHMAQVPGFAFADGARYPGPPVQYSLPEQGIPVYGGLYNHTQGQAMQASYGFIDSNGQVLPGPGVIHHTQKLPTQ